jgi:ferredoxin
MADPLSELLICSCEDTMPLDVAALRTGCPNARITRARQLCRAEIERFRGTVAAGGRAVVGCTQEKPLFEEIVAESGTDSQIVYVNVRETAGWSREAPQSGPKMAALIAAASEPVPPVPTLTIASEGTLLIYGCDDRALEAAKLLQEHLDVTVLIKPSAVLIPLPVRAFAIVQGTIRTVTGHFGAFELTIAGFAQAVPSSRGTLAFGRPADVAASRCDIILDLSGGALLFSAAELREGYLRADPADPAGVLRAVLQARDLVGEFEKPRYVAFDAAICAYSRSRIQGCTRCLDVCPVGAITPDGDSVAIDGHLCAGCGQCASVCPTGAASYAMPPVDVLMRKLRTLILTYRAAGGGAPIVLLHDEAHGGQLIDALARFGAGLPANVVPLAVNEVTQIGLEVIAAVFAYGASGLCFLRRVRPRADAAALEHAIGLADAILVALGFGEDRIRILATDDPEQLASSLGAVPAALAAPNPATFVPAGPKQALLRIALRELQRAAPARVEVIALPRGAPVGAIEIEAERCTLCLSCVSACPTGALTDDPDRPMLRFNEDACVQCGLCKATCPERVITLKPQIDFRAATAGSRVLKEEEPFRCIRCGTPFGVKSTIERVAAKLADTHWMYKGSPERLEAIKMCDSCRVAVISEQSFDPHAPPRPPVRTGDDYLRDREDPSSSRSDPC